MSQQVEEMDLPRGTFRQLDITTADKVTVSVAPPSSGITPDQETIILLEADLEIAREKLRQIEAVVNNAPELNMSNYDVDQVVDLNNAMIEIWQILQPDESDEII